jgi:hypothetical protein
MGAVQWPARHQDSPRNPEAVMSNLDLNDWEFADDEEANMAIRAAVHYRLMGVAGSGRGGIVTEIIEIVRQAVHDQPDQPDPFDDDAPGG